MKYSYSRLTLNYFEDILLTSDARINKFFYRPLVQKLIPQRMLLYFDFHLFLLLS